MKKYEFIEHPADIKMLAYGKNLPELFINAALGMMECLFGKKIFDKKVIGKEQIVLRADDIESLMVDWLSHLLYLSATEYSVYVEYDIKKLDNYNIFAEIGFYEAQAIDNIKAATYHELKIEDIKGVWRATVVFDI